MEYLSNEEALNVSGGAFGKGLIFGIIGGTLVFLCGLIDGFINPKKCN